MEFLMLRKGMVLWRMAFPCVELCLGLEICMHAKIDLEAAIGGEGG